MMLRLHQYVGPGPTKPVLVNTDWIEMVMDGPEPDQTRIALRDAVIDVVEAVEKIADLMEEGRRPDPVSESELPGSTFSNLSPDEQEVVLQRVRQDVAEYKKRKAAAAARSRPPEDDPFRGVIGVVHKRDESP